MGKNLQRLLSVTLAVLLVFGCAVSACAAEAGHTHPVFQKIESTGGTVLLVWFDRYYTQEGGSFSVTVSRADAQAYDVPQAEMRRTVWERTDLDISERDRGTYPVLFVHMPQDLLSDVTSVCVSAGAFRSPSGEDSPELCIRPEELGSGDARIGLRCKAVVTGLQKLGYHVVPNTTLAAHSIFYKELAAYSYDGVPVEDATVADVGSAGKHVLRAEVAPGFYEEIVLRVDSPAGAYCRSLGQHTVYMMMVPFALLSVLPLGLGALLILPGFAYAALAPVGWSITAVKAFFQSFASVQGKEYEFRAE